MPDDVSASTRYRRLARECLEIAHTFPAGERRAALGGRVRGQHRAPAAAARGGAAGHAAATAGSAQGRRQTGLGAGGVRIPALTYLFVFGADIDDFGICVPGDPAGLRVIVRASAFFSPATGRRVEAGTNAEA